MEELSKKMGGTLSLQQIEQFEALVGTGHS